MSGVAKATFGAMNEFAVSSYDETKRFDLLTDAADLAGIIHLCF